MAFGFRIALPLSSLPPSLQKQQGHGDALDPNLNLGTVYTMLKMLKEARKPHNATIDHAIARIESQKWEDLTVDKIAAENCRTVFANVKSIKRDAVEWQVHSKLYSCLSLQVW